MAAAVHAFAGAEAVAYAADMAQRFVVVSGNGESWVLGGEACSVEPST